MGANYFHTPTGISSLLLVRPMTERERWHLIDHQATPPTLPPHLYGPAPSVLPPLPVLLQGDIGGLAALHCFDPPICFFSFQGLGPGGTDSWLQ